jgi:hypothetical protein
VDSVCSASLSTREPERELERVLVLAKLRQCLAGEPLPPSTGPLGTGCVRPLSDYRDDRRGTSRLVDFKLDLHPSLKAAQPCVEPSAMNEQFFTLRTLDEPESGI